MQSYGVMPNGAAIDLYILGKETGLLAQIKTYGGTTVGIEMPDPFEHYNLIYGKNGAGK